MSPAGGLVVAFAGNVVGFPGVKQFAVTVAMQNGTMAPLEKYMSGTGCVLTPFRGVSSSGVVHWCGVPSLIHGVAPPCKCSVARFWRAGSAPMKVSSIGMNKLPPCPVGRRFLNSTRTGRSFCARITGPRYDGVHVVLVVFASWQ